MAHKLGVVRVVGDTVQCPHGHEVELLEMQRQEPGGLLAVLATDCEICREAGLSWDVPDPDLQGWPREGLEVWVDLKADAPAR